MSDGATEMVVLTIDGREVQASPGELLIKAAEDNGTHIPRFCWYPRMNPVGMCRMCLVEIETPRGRMIVPSCMQPVSDGMVVYTDSEPAQKAQEGVLEFLLLNHPLDCPVCDKGGECPLQDQTMSYGPGESRFVEEKRHFAKPIPISDLVLLDRERCILCARCTRFSDEISGDPLIEFQGRGAHTQVLTFPDEPFNSYFSGNTVQICPVGALTAVPYRFRARPWDLTIGESTGTVHTEGSSISVHVSQNRVLRFLGVDNDATNQGWLSDKERFGFEFIGSPDRLRMPLIKEGSDFREAEWGEALDLVAERLGRAIEKGGGNTIAALGGARGTNEDAYALSKFMRTTVGSNHLDAQLGDGLPAGYLAGWAGRGRIEDIDRASTILLWGPDLKETHPTLYLRVRRAAQERGATLIVVHPRRTGLDDRATFKLTYRPGEGDRLLSRIRSGEDDLAPVRAALENGPVVALVGRPGLAEDVRLVESVAAVARSFGASLLPLVHRGNTFGAIDMGVSPQLLPGRMPISNSEDPLVEAWGSLPSMPGLDAAGIASACHSGDIDLLLLYGADPSRDLVGFHGDAALSGAGFVVALDLFLTDSSRQADVVLPALGFGEKKGTVTNLEGRVQMVNRLVPGPGQARADWSVLDDLAHRLGRPLGLTSAQEISDEIARLAPAYRGITWQYLEREVEEGAVAPLEPAHQTFLHEPQYQAPNGRESSTHTLHLARTLYDDGVLLRHTPSLAPLSPGGHAYLTPGHAASLEVEEGDQVTVRIGDQTLRLPVGIDPSLSEGTVYIPFNQPGVATVTNGLEVGVKAGEES
ncbi:MAG: NADH-quinone oxidoreductase subunit NuoG [Acidimicrobiia bacterium]|nr:NADH-quinone oxidoreductase subunit NuoG [Acidimicrobiia bacterium]